MQDSLRAFSLGRDAVSSYECEQLDSLSLESYEIDDESFNSEDSNEEVDVEDSTNNYQGPIQPYMFEPEVDGDLSEGGDDSLTRG